MNWDCEIIIEHSLGRELRAITEDLESCPVHVMEPPALHGLREESSVFCVFMFI